MRRLAQEVELHLAYRWFLGYDLDEPTPDHSVRAVEGEGPLRARGLRGVLPPIHRAVPAGGAARRGTGLRRHHAHPGGGFDGFPGEEGRAGPARAKESHAASPPPALPDQPAPPRSRKPHPDRHRRRANNELQSRTDWEASVISRQGFGLHLAYKAHLAVAGEPGQVIAAALATTGAAADEHLLGEVLWQHRRLSKLPTSELVADAKYGTAPNYLYLHQAGISAFIPPKRYGHQQDGIWGRKHFRWLSEEDAFLCPAGQRLQRFTNVTTTRGIGYRAPKGSCVDCQFRPQCAPSGRARTIHRLWEQHLVEAALQLTATLWASSGLLSGRRGQRVPLPWRKSCTGCAGRGSKADGGCRFSSG